MSQKRYNLRAVGIGGKGVVKFSSLLEQAAVDAGIQVTMVERPRSAMRLSPITCDIIFYQAHLASFIAPGDADVVFSLEPLDGLMNASYYLKKGGLALLGSSGTETIAELVSGEKDGRAQECWERVDAFGGRIVEVDAVKASIDITGDERGAHYYLLGVLCALEPGFPLSAEQIRPVLSGGTLACFEKGLEYKV